MAPISGFLDSNSKHADAIGQTGKIVRTSEGAFEIRVAQSFGNCPKYIQARQHQFSDDNVENQEKKW